MKDKIKKRIDMIVGLAIVGGKLGELSRAHDVGMSYGVKTSEVKKIIDNQMAWARTQGYKTLINSYLLHLN